MKMKFINERDRAKDTNYQNYTLISSYTHKYTMTLMMIFLTEDVGNKNNS